MPTWPSPEATSRRCVSAMGPPSSGARGAPYCPRAAGRPATGTARPAIPPGGPTVPDGDPTTSGLPLYGVRVLAVEQYGAGPFGSLHLADLGADVIKVEDPGAGGDVGRTTPPYTTGSPATGDHDSLFFQAFNRDKRS